MPLSRSQADALFKSECVFAAAAPDPTSLPSESLPEVAFIGRSNAGKSSLINALVRKKVAYASGTPGRTQQLNFFRLDNRLLIVDMPGYGFAKAPAHLAIAWSDLSEYYLKNRATLRRLYLLLDSARGVMPIDREVITFLNKLAIPFALVFTKADRVKKEVRDGLAPLAGPIIAKAAAAWPECIVTSTKTGEGLDELRLAVAQNITS
jgi:GTP-binding protein